MGSGDGKSCGRVIVITTEGCVVRGLCASLDKWSVDYVVCADLYEAVEVVEARDIEGAVILAGRLSEFCRDGRVFFDNVFSPDTMRCVCLVDAADIAEVDGLALAIGAGAYPAGDIDTFCGRLRCLADELSKAEHEERASHGQKTGSAHRRGPEIKVLLTQEERQGLLGGCGGLGGGFVLRGCDEG